MRSLALVGLFAFAVIAFAGPDLAGQGRGAGAPGRSWRT